MIAADPDASLIYGLAVRLGKFPGELMDRPVHELRGLAAYTAHMAEAQKHNFR